MENLSGSVERITYYNAENGYSVIRLRPEGASGRAVNREGLVTAVGNLPELSAGEHLRLQGQWINHPTHGMQFQIEICEQTLPATVAGMRRYLGSGLIKGIGPRLAERIVARFGADTLAVIEDHPERLREVADIGPAQRLVARLGAEGGEIMPSCWLWRGTNLAIKIYKRYVSKPCRSYKQSYRWRYLRGGFQDGRPVASAGAADGSPIAHQAGVVYTLNELSDDEHVARQLLADKRELLGNGPI
jgi:exodeoxyribonuclease V alpha subunit